METLTGTIERITFYNEENGYTVLKMTPDEKQQPGAAARDGTVAVVGSMAELAPGEVGRIHWRVVQRPALGFAIPGGDGAPGDPRPPRTASSIT